MAGEYSIGCSKEHVSFYLHSENENLDFQEMYEMKCIKIVHRLDLELDLLHTVSLLMLPVCIHNLRNCRRKSSLNSSKISREIDKLVLSLSCRLANDCGITKCRSQSVEYVTKCIELSLAFSKWQHSLK